MRSGLENSMRGFRWPPYLAPALSAGGLRSLVGCDAVIPNRSVFWVRQDVVDKGKPAVEIIARSLADTDR